MRGIIGGKTLYKAITRHCGCQFVCITVMSDESGKEKTGLQFSSIDTEAADYKEELGWDMNDLCARGWFNYEIPTEQEGRNYMVPMDVIMDMLERVKAESAEKIIVFLDNYGNLEFVNNLERKHVIFKTLPDKLMGWHDNHERITDRSERPEV